jgi:ATP-dependent RNA helicase DDX51/DBP6
MVDRLGIYRLQGGCSAVDIVICTPGRLMDHLKMTQNFTLQHVRYLIMDEVDRLLNQSYRDWLSKLWDALEGEPLSPRPQEMHPFYVPDGCSTRLSSDTIFTEISLAIPIQKLLFSATLTHNPEKLAHLRLVNPICFSVQTDARYIVPETLQEYMVLCDMNEKPLIVLYLMLHQHMSATLCFTSSVETTHRLYRLLQLHGGISVAEYSSQLSQKERHEIINQFCRGKIQLLVCSDGMARGMDLQQNVQYVINYDKPAYIKTYIHRVGRTARAGRQGTTFTLLQPEDIDDFNQMLQKTSRKQMNVLPLHRSDLEPYLERYEYCLKELQVVIELEKRGSSSKTASLQLTTSSEKSALLHILRCQLITQAQQ